MDSPIAAERCVSHIRQAVFEPSRSRGSAVGPLLVWRALPVRERRLIGPWCFLDRYGPVSFSGQKAMDVAPHPHIGLQTVSWLLDGEVVHKDSLGFDATVRAGGVNVMTAGSGIAHAEETPPQNSGRLNGVQLWIVLPDADRTTDAAFEHVGEVPTIDLAGALVRVFAGELDNAVCPARMFSDVVGCEVAVHRHETAVLPLKREREHGIFVLEGDAAFEGHPLAVNTLYYLGFGRTEAALGSREGARLLVIGGAPFRVPVLMWWNFVARQPEEILAARTDWEEGRRFGPVRGYEGERLAAPPLSRLARPNPAS